MNITYLQAGRRLNRWLVSMMICLISGISWRVSANDLDSYEIHKVTDQVYIFSFVWDELNRSNIGVVIGKDGLLLINTMMLNKVDKLEEALKSISSKPVKYVLNSNYDWWSTSANKYFADKGAIIFGHQNTEYMSHGFSQILFNKTLTLDLGTEQIFVYPSEGHSYSHVNIQLKNANVIWLADSYSRQWPSTMGPNGLAGYTQGLESAMALGNEQTQFVTGGGTLLTGMINSHIDLKAEIQVRRTFFNRVTELINLGKSNKDIITDHQLNKVMLYYVNPNKWSIESWLINPIRFYNQQRKHSVSQKQLEQLVGQYQYGDELIIEVFLKNNMLIAGAKGFFMGSLSPLSERQFMFDPQNDERLITFKFDSKGNVESLNIIIEKDSNSYLTVLTDKMFKKILL